MPYEVTATRRRPKTFEELAGQEFVASTLKNSLETKHIAHAYLFSGPRGCGKTSTARLLAKALRCEQGPTANPCGVCAQCTEIARGASMDVIEIDGASNTGVNDVRQIKEEVLFPPSSGRYKVYIIDEVHMLSNSAFNALLKTIEEPPPNVVFIFATTELQKVPGTIKSRCQQFNFRLFPIEVIKKMLEEACKETGIEAEDEALFWIARESTGSLRDAYTILDQVVSFSEGHIRTEIIREKLGLVGLERLNEFAEACASGNYLAALEKIDSLLGAGVALETFVTDLAGYYHSLLLLKAGITRESILGYPPERFSHLVLEKLDEARLARAGELLFNLHRDIRYSLSPRFELETLTSRLCRLDCWISETDLAGAVEKAAAILRNSRPLAEAPREGRFPEAQTKKEPAAETREAKEITDENRRSEGPGVNSVVSPGGGINTNEAGFLLEGFKRYRAEKEKTFSATTESEAGAESSPQELSEVEVVLKVFNGTIVIGNTGVSGNGTNNGNGSANEYQPF